MFRKYFYLIFILFLTTQVKANNIATLNIELILAKSVAAQNAAAQIKEKLDLYQIEINKKSELLKREQNDLMQQSNILTQEALEAKQRDFVAKIQNLENEVKEKKQQLDSLYVKAVSQIETNIGEIIKEISKEENYNLILASNDIIYAHNIADLTEKVLNILNKKLTKVEISAE